MSDYSDGGRIEIDGPDGFRMIPDTLIFNSVIKDLDVRLYSVLLWHGRSGNGIFPGRKLLAQELSKNSVRTIDGSFDRLQEQGYLTITPQFDETGGQDRNRYRLYFTPLPPEQRQATVIQPAIDTRTVKAQLSTPVQKIARGVEQAAESEGGGAKNCTGPRATNCAPPVQETAHLKGKELKRNKDQEKEDLPPAAGGLPTGGRGAEAAAVPAGIETPAATKTEQPAASSAPRVAPAAAVYETLPEDLRRRISRSASGKVLSAIQRELANRSVPELAERVERRWTWWLHTGQRVNDPVATAITLIRARHCPNQRCEDGQDLDQGDACTACKGQPGTSNTPPPSPAAPAAIPAATPAAAGAVAPTAAVTATPIPPTWSDRLSELNKLVAATPDDEDLRPQPQTAPVQRGDRAQKAIEAARAAMIARKLSGQERALQAAKQVHCEKCGAEEGFWCVSDGVETPGLVHSDRVVRSRTGQPSAHPEDEGMVA
ncbi:hypothetical protein GCM10010412_082480 [Nonomuraea recticatena]|uniref:Helix-turn-helix domain-containing protein n=1 Tax=Nonomuraea recticatena TaxID=46178 RepID=A0ABP6FI46_9ACTN